MKFGKIQFEILTLALSLIAIMSCNNNYEHEVMGDYKVYNYEMKNYQKTDTTPIVCKLFLHKDKTFLMENDKAIIKGTWKAGDDGDRTWIKFSFGTTTSEGVIGGDSLNVIEIWNPQDFGYSFLKSLTLKR